MRRSNLWVTEIAAPQELQHLTSSFQQLKSAQAKFKACLANVEEVKPANKGTLLISTEKTRKCSYCADKTILVPLTNSLYVPGKLSDSEYVIVDVGTGYYVRKVRHINHGLAVCPFSNSVS